MTSSIRYNRPTVAVVGSGPAGCIAAWACHMQGITVDVYTNAKEPSHLPGAQYLHSPFVLPNDAAVQSRTITYAKLGTREGYAKKIYGKKFDPAETSWDLFPAGVVKGWSLRAVYDLLHEWAEPRMQQKDIGLHEMEQLCEVYDIVLNSAPGWKFVLRPAEHSVEMVWVKTEMSSNDDRSPGENIIVYDGNSNIPQYRFSHLEGKSSWEYPYEYGKGFLDPDLAGLILVSKPLSLNAVPIRPNLIPIGRYGKWKKGELVDAVFREVTRRLTPPIEYSHGL